MTIPFTKPESVMSHIRRDTRQLWFPNGAQGEFYIRGAVCWPITTETKSLLGFALLAGVNVDTGVCHVFEQREFTTVHAITDDEKRIQDPGLGSWLVKMWGLYHANRYYWSQAENLHRINLLHVLRNTRIEPKPCFIHAKWTDPNEALSSMWNWFNSGMIIIQADTPVHAAFMRYTTPPGGPELGQNPIMHALVTLLHGLALYPWRKLHVERDIFVA